MRVPDAWARTVERTALGDHEVRRRLDRRVRGWLGQRRGLRGADQGSMAAFTVDRAYLDILRLAPNWLACTTTIALAGGLVLCARAGSTLADVAKRDWHRRVNEQAWIDVQAMNLIRNAVCHPEDPPIPALCSHIETWERETRELTGALRADWSLLGDQRVAKYGLGKLDAVIRHVIDRYRI